MATRRSIILSWADQQSNEAIDRVPDTNTSRKANLKKVYAVCRALVNRKKPIYPSAREVAESGKLAAFQFNDFPAEQTLHNAYSDMLSLWRKTFRDIETLHAEPGASTDQLLAWDASHLDSGDIENIRSLQRLLKETILRNSALKTLITDHVYINRDQLQPENTSVIEDLAHWMDTVTLDGFSLSEFGLVVTPRSPAGTIVMHQPLWQGLERMVSAYQLSEKSLGQDSDVNEV